MSLAFLLAPLPGGGDDAPVESCSNLELDQERRTKESFLLIGIFTWPHKFVNVPKLGVKYIRNCELQDFRLITNLFLIFKS